MSSASVLPRDRGTEARRGTSAARTLRRREGFFGYAMILLSVVFVGLFTAVPIIASFVLSMFSWDVISPARFVGLDNYARLLGDGAVVQSFGVTLALAAAIIALQIGFGLILAVIVHNRRSKLLRTVFRTAFYLPLLASTASVAIFMGYLFDARYGLINYYLGLLGVPSVPWLTSPVGAGATVVMVAVWQQVGFTFVLFVAALTSLPADVLEAAEVDGAGPLRRLVRVELPLISPTIFFATVIGAINALQLFDQPYIMTKGGPGTATTTATIVIYQTAFQNLQFGYGSAIAMVLLLIILIVTGVQFVLSRRLVFYS